MPRGIGRGACTRLLLVALTSAALAETVVTTRHTDRTIDMAVSPDGSLLTTAGDDGLVTVWEARTGQTRRVFDGHRESVPVGVGFMSDGQTVVSVDTDGAVHFWTWDGEGKPRRTLRVAAGSSRSADMTRAGDIVVTAEAEYRHGERLGAVRLWDLDGGALRRLLVPSVAEAEVVAISPDGMRVALACSAEPGVCLWDITSPTTARRLAAHGDRANCVTFSHDGSLLASASHDGVHLWEAATGRMIRRVTTEETWTVALSRDGRHIATGGDGLVTLHETATGARRSTTGVRGGVLFAAAFCADDSVVAVGGGGGHLTACSVADGHIVWRTDRPD